MNRPTPQPPAASPPAESPAFPAIATVVLVGHCGADAWSLEQAVRSAAPHVKLVTAYSQNELQKLARPDVLWLINRSLGGFNAPQGVDLIRQFHSPTGPRMMLISNYADAQSQAVDAGALPGFGKSDLHQAATLEMLQQAINPAG